MKNRQFIKEFIEPYVLTIQKYISELRSTGSVSSVHQLRVNIRRLRNMLWVFSCFFSKKKIKRWDTNLKQVADVASQVRDLDVYVGFLRRYIKSIRNLEEKKVIMKMIADLQAARPNLEREIVNVIDVPGKKGLAATISELLSVTAKKNKVNDTAEIYKICRKAVLKRVRQLISYDPIVYQPAEVEKLHQMRISAKHLRYGLEGIKKIYDDGINSQIKRITSFHTQLGEIHDYNVWQVYASKYAGNRKFAPNARRAFNALERYIRVQRANVYQEFVKNWTRSKGERLLEDIGEYMYAYQFSCLGRG